MYKEHIVKHIQDSVAAKQRLLQNDALLEQMRAGAASKVTSFPKGKR